MICFPMGATLRSSNPTRCQMKLFRSLDVWERRDDVLVRYRCFEDLGTARFWVQSADFYRDASDDKRRAWLEKEFIAVLAESTPTEKDLFDSLKEAIARHKTEFG